VYHLFVKLLCFLAADVYANLPHHLCTKRGVESECWKGSCTIRFIVLGGAFSKKDEFCTFKGYDVDALMRNILVKSANNKKRTLEILLPVYWPIDSVVPKVQKNEGLQQENSCDKPKGA
jgi:hypothetical protein